MANDDSKNLQKLVSVINEKLDKVLETQEDHTSKLDRLEDKTDALSGDIEQLHNDVKAIKDKQGMYHSRNKREIDEIKTHLNLPLMPDSPVI